MGVCGLICANLGVLDRKKLGNRGISTTINLYCSKMQHKIKSKTLMDHITAECVLLLLILKSIFAETHIFTQVRF